MRSKGGLEMLSNHNVEKLNMNGIYECEPDIKYRGKLYEDNLYHCCNWIFEIVKNHEGNYFMRDTYWSSGDSLHILLTNENIDNFKRLFDKDKVKRIRGDETNHYENYYRVAVDSGGWTYPKYFVDANKTKSKDLFIKELDEKIAGLEREIKRLKEQKENIENGTYKVEWF